MLKAATDYALDQFITLKDYDPVEYMYLLYNADESLVQKWIVEKALEFIKGQSH